MYNNNFYPQQQTMYGHAFGAARPQALNTQPLSQERVDILRKDGTNLNMQIDEKDIWRSQCTHKEPATGQSTLVQEDDGSYRCSICGASFNFFDGERSQIENAVKTLVDMLQTCKTIYLDAPVAMTEQYYQIIPLLQKFPNLWDFAVRNFSKYDNVNSPINPISPNYSGFNALNTLLANPYAFNPQMAGYNPQMMNPQMMNPQMAGYNSYGQPQMMNPQMQYTADPSGNPMAYGMPNTGAPAAGVMPGGNMPANVPAANPTTTSGNEVQQQKLYNV